MKKKDKELEYKEDIFKKKEEYIKLIAEYVDLCPHLDRIPLSIKKNELSNADTLELCSALFEIYSIGVTMKSGDKEYFIEVYVR